MFFLLTWLHGARAGVDRRCTGGRWLRISPSVGSLLPGSVSPSFLPSPPPPSSSTCSSQPTRAPLSAAPAINIEVIFFFWQLL